MFPTKLKKVVTNKGDSTSGQRIILLAGSIFLIGLFVYLSEAPKEASSSSTASSSSSSSPLSSVREEIVPNYAYQIRPGGNSAVKIKIGGTPQNLPLRQPAVPENSEALANDDDDYDEAFPYFGEKTAELLVDQETYDDDDSTAAEDNNNIPESVLVSSKEELLEATPVATSDKEQTLHTPSSPLLRTSTNTDSSTSTTTTTLIDAQQVRDRSPTSALLKALDKARDAFFEKLKIDYGVEQYENMFFTTTDDGQRVTRGRTFMTSPSGAQGVSFERLQRKFVKKILLAQITGKTVPFVWATGGHSAAAGHGNLYNESSTAVLERNGLIFSAVGLRLEGRNYAMGGTSSGMEIASCSKEVFGKDIDILSWDYGMTDVNRPHRMELYMYRAFANENRPACIGINVGLTNKWKDVMKSLEERGLTVLYKDDREARDIDEYIPDTLGKSQAEIDAMPAFIRSYKCGNAERELGEPTCAISKFTDTHDVDCEKRRFRVSWHPGWKYHALQGNLNTLFLMEVLYDALHKIQTRQEESNDNNFLATDRQMLLELQKQEDADYNLYQQSDLPPLSEGVLQLPDEQQKKEVLSILYKQPNYCHTARLPAEIRHKGILTMSQQKGFCDYDKGTEWKDANQMVSFPNDTIPLVYDQSKRQKCQFNIQVDYMDFFYLHGKQQGDSKLLLPNAEEQKEYGVDDKTKGIVALCFFMCDWGACPKDSVNAQEVMEGKASFHVNDVPVSNLTLFGETPDCYLLTNEEQGPYWKANDNDQYEIRARVQDPEMYMRINAFIIW